MLNNIVKLDMSLFDISNLNLMLKSFLKKLLLNVKMGDI